MPTEEALDEMTQRVKDAAPAVYAYIQSKNRKVKFAYEDGGFFDNIWMRTDESDDDLTVVLNSDYSQFDQFVNFTEKVRQSDEYKKWLKENTTPEPYSISPIYNSYAEKKFADFQKFERVQVPWMKRAGATDAEIENARYFQIAYTIVGPGEAGEQLLLAVGGPAAAKGGANFNRGAAKAQAAINARIDGIQGTQACLISNTAVPRNYYPRTTIVGTEKIPPTGAQPNSIYVRTTKHGAAVQTTIHDQRGRAIGHIDWKDGEAHIFTVPGDPSSGHGPGSAHIPLFDARIPLDWHTLPSGVRPVLRRGR